MKTEEWLPIDRLIEQNKTHFDDEMKGLVDVCDSNSDIAEFVSTLVNGSLADRYGEEYRRASALNHLVWKICGLDVLTSMTNPFHYSGGWLDELNLFIDNYFLGCLCFSVTRENYFKVWEAMADNKNGTQHPLVLVAAAKDNDRFYRKVAGLQGEEGKRCMKEGMESSGEVERLLNRTHEE